MTPLAVICWAMWLGYLPRVPWAGWLGSLAAVVIFTICMVGEWVVDVLPQTPSRRDLPLATARIVTGVLVSCIMWTLDSQPWAGGVIIGFVGAIIGTRLGYRVRVWAARKVGKDWPVGITESALVFALSLFMMYDMHKGLAIATAHFRYL